MPVCACFNELLALTGEIVANLWPNVQSVSFKNGIILGGTCGWQARHSSGAIALSVMVRVEYAVDHVHSLHMCHPGFISLRGLGRQRPADVSW